MKNSIPLLFLLFLSAGSAAAQTLKTDSPDPEPRLIVGATIGFQWFQNINRFGALHLEYAVGQSQHIGVNITKVFEGSSSSYYYNESLQKGSFDVGIDAKYFLHGRFTGRKSGFYIGPDVRIGIRRFAYQEYDYVSGMLLFVKNKQKTSKFMFSWGNQWHFGRHVVLDIAVPFGIEALVVDNRYNSIGVSSERSFVMLPNIMLGIAF